jgi:hypothetical protein
VRQIAWYNTAPSDSKGIKLKTRLQSLLDEGETPIYPPRPIFENIINWLFDAGPVMAGGMGSAPLSHGEIRAWMDNTGEVITAWEVRTIRRLSNDYVAAIQDAEKPDCKAPFSDSEEAKKRINAELERKLNLFFS